MRLVLKKFVLVGVWVLRVEFVLLWNRYIPRQVASSHEVNQDDAQGFQVISTRMLITLVATER